MPVILKDKAACDAWLDGNYDGVSDVRAPLTVPPRRDADASRRFVSEFQQMRTMMQKMAAGQKR